MVSIFLLRARGLMLLRVFILDTKLSFLAYGKTRRRSEKILSPREFTGSGIIVYSPAVFQVIRCSSLCAVFFVSLLVDETMNVLTERLF